MDVQTIRDLFLHDLGDIYDAERKIAKMLPILASEVIDNPSREALQEHERETLQQIANLERCFQILNARMPNTTCPVADALQKEHDNFLKEGPPQVLLTLFNLGAAAKTEHYEIACYRGLVAKAKLMGEEECYRLLEENLRQEEEMAQRVERLEQQFGQQHIPHAQQADR
ncbi:MAG: ferritin-like domain-containing protein [Ardenticatenales bacterium]|nr:ferritin-like domain-containing protein [Ardenticatenales bacterium]